MTGGPPKRKAHPNGEGELKQALKACRSAFWGVAIISAFVNILMLTGALYMLEIYDRVLPSRSVPTLIGLSLLVAALFAFQAVLEMIRGRVMVRIGASLDESLSGRVYKALVQMPLRARVAGDGIQPLRDLDQIRGYFSGPGPTALFDLPWIPVYLGICFAFHPLIGVVATAGGLVLIALTFLAEYLTRKPVAEASVHGARRNGLAEASRRNAEALHAMGMAGHLAERWAKSNEEFQATTRSVGDISTSFGAVSKIMRLGLQSAVLGIGAYLVIHQQATAGIIIAASILTSRALAPIELVIGHWKGFVAARQGWRRLSELLRLIGPAPEPMALEPASAALDVTNLSVVPPGTKIVTAGDVSFSLSSGEGVGIIGPSASGKSSLVRALIGVWTPARGAVRLDRATLDQWSPEQLGRNIGYLPQDVELLSGNVAENIFRFEANPDPQKVVAAAQAAGVHDIILRLPQGYETDVGEGGAALSAGQRQRVALARALYDDPFLVVLDEPNSNLDMEGEEALGRAMMHVRERGGIVVVVSHRPTALTAVSHVLVMTDNRMHDFGPRDQVMSKLLRASMAQSAHAARPLRVVPDNPGG